MSSDPELIAVLERLDGHMHSWFGTGSFLGKKSSGSSNDVSSVSASARKLDETIRKTTTSVQALAGGHESALRHILRSVADVGAIGGAISLLVNGVFEMSKTYSKLTDIGQMFGGSMFTMASQAGAAGLSLGDFSKAMLKHSQSAAFMTNSQTGATNAFMDVQKKVRDGLEKVGFYGMSLSELTDATFDYVDIMKTSGRITKMNSADLANGAQRFLAQVSGISAASGMSREEIIKTTKQMVEEPDINTTLAGMGEGAQKSWAALIPALDQFGLSGKEILKYTHDILVSPTKNWANTKSVVETYNSVGAAQQAEMVQVLANKVMSGSITPENANKMATQWALEYKNSVYANRVVQSANLQEKREILKTVNDFLFLTPKAVAERIAADEKAKALDMDPITHAINQFPGKFEMVTGKFKESFFDTFLMHMTGFGGLEKNYEKNPDGSNNLDKQIPNTPQQIAAYKKAHPQNLDEKGNIKDISSIYALMEKLGEKLGGPLGDIIQHFITWLDKLEPAQIDAGVKSLEAFIIAIGGIISTTVNMFTDTSSVIGPAGAALLFIGGTKFITSLLGNIAGKFMGGATAAATASTAGGVLSRAQGLKAAGFGGLFVGMLTAYGSEILFNSVLDSVVSDDNPMKANIKKYGDIIAPIVGGLFGPMLIRGIVAILVEGALIPALAGITTVALIAAIAIYMNQKNNEKIDEAAAKRGYYPAPPSAFTPYNEYDPDNGYVNKNGKTLSRQQSNPAFEDARKNLYEKRLKENRINPKTNKPYTPKEIHDDIWGEDDTTGTKSDAGGWTVTPTDNSKMVPIEIDGKKALVNPLAQKAFQSILDEGHRLGYHWSSLGGWAASGHVPGSHHYDGTAFDGNPATNPYGPPGGPLVTDMPKALIDFAEKIPGIHWGGRFSNRKDAMHFEYHPGEVGLAPNTPPSKLASNTSEEPHYINKPAMPEPNTPEPETSMEQLRLQNDDLTEKWTAEKEFSHHKKEYLEKVRGSTGLHGDVYTDNENWVMLLKDMRDLHRQQLAVQAKMAKEQERTTDAAKGAPIVGRGK